MFLRFDFILIFYFKMMVKVVILTKILVFYLGLFVFLGVVFFIARRVGYIKLWRLHDFIIVAEELNFSQSIKQRLG